MRLNGGFLPRPGLHPTSGKAQMVGISNSIPLLSKGTLGTLASLESGAKPDFANGKELIWTIQERGGPELAGDHGPEGSE